MNLESLAESFVLSVLSGISPEEELTLPDILRSGKFFVDPSVRLTPNLDVSAHAQSVKLSNRINDAVYLSSDHFFVCVDPFYECDLDSDSIIAFGLRTQLPCAAYRGREPVGPRVGSEIDEVFGHCHSFNAACFLFSVSKYWHFDQARTLTAAFESASHFFMEAFDGTDFLCWTKQGRSG